jgi:iron complex outermembrane recepter protein
MCKILTTITFIFLAQFVLFAQQISGTVVDHENEKPLPGVNVVLIDGNHGEVTNIDGKFTFDVVRPGIYNLEISFVGYRQKNIAVEITSVDIELGNIMLVATDFDLGEVIVTATPTGSNVRYQANQIFSGELLQRKSDMSIGLMLDGEPGVSMRSFGPAPARPVIRGLDGDRVLVLENGERMGDLSGSAHDHVVAIDPLATDRIEVVRGPASLLYGSSAMGGVVNLLTQDVPYHWEKGSNGKIGLQGASVNSMFGLFGRYMHGWDNYALTGRLSYRNSGATQTPSGLMEGTDTRSFDASVGMGFRYKQSQGGFALIASDMIYGIPEEFENPGDRVEIRLQKQMAHFRLRSRMTGFFDRLEWRFQAGQFAQQEIVVELNEEGEEEEEVELEFSQWSLSSTFTLQHKPFSVFDRGAVGLNIYGRQLDVGGGDAFTPGDQNLNLAVFAFEEIPISRHLRFQLGARGELSYLETRANEFFPEIDEQRSHLNFSASAGMNYSPTEQWETGIQVARAFKNPSLEELFAYGPHLGAGTFEIGQDDLKSESSLGLDAFTRWDQKRWFAEIALFYTHINNFIIFAPAGEIQDDYGLPIFRYEPDKARLFGGELAGAFLVTEQITITTGLDYVYGERLNEAREPLPFMPPLRSRLAIQWDKDKFYAGADARYLFSQNRVASDEETTPGYLLLGLEAGYRMDYKGRHVLMFKVHNLLNESYRDHLSRVRERANPMPGRSFNLAYHWVF